MMNCSELLRDYSDYKDGLMEPSRRDSVEAHLRRCPSCARYHAVLDRGVRELCALPPVEPASDFVDRLHYRIQEDRLAAAAWSRPDSSAVSVGAVLLVALTIAAASWVPVLHRARAAVELPPAIAMAPPVDPVPTLFRAGPLLTPSARVAYVHPASSSIFHRYTAVGYHAVDRPRPLLGTR